MPIPQKGIAGIVFAIIHTERELGLCSCELAKMNRFMVPGGLVTYGKSWGVATLERRQVW